MGMRRTARLGRRAVLAVAGLLPMAAFGDDLLWRPEDAPAGPVLVLVSLTLQRAFVYRDGILIGETPVSTGRPGHPTPTGVFTILQKAAVHHSSTYDDAAMPYDERLTWDGVSLHAGGLPGYPSSHGCVHLPLGFARLLFGVTEVGTTVVIADERSAPYEVVHPGPLLPTTELAESGGGQFWEPQRAPSGPLSLLLSVADRRIYVERNGVEIGTAPVRLLRPEAPVLPAVLVLRRGPEMAGASWLQVDRAPGGGSSDVLDRLKLPPDFAAALNAQLVPGTVLDCVQEPADPARRTGPGFTVVATQPGV